MMDQMIRFERDVPIVARTQTLVVGGGPAGIGAALGAARAGMATTLVEHYGFLGGMATAGLVGPFMTSFSNDGSVQVVGGIFEELVRRCEALGGAIHPDNVSGGTPEAGFRDYGHDRVTPFDPEVLKVVADDMLTEAGVELRFHTTFVEPLMDGDRIRGIVTHSKSGMQALLADMVIDCTGDADVAHLAGVPTVKGRERDGLMQPITLFLRVGNVNDAALETYIKESGDNSPPFSKLAELARSRGDFPIPRDRVGLFRTPSPGVWWINCTNMHGLDGTNVDDLCVAEVEGRRQVMALMRFLREYVPGQEHVTLVDTATQVGVRETRRIIGEYVLTVEDLVGPTRFPDTVALGGFPVDIHSPTEMGGGCSPAYNAAPVYEIPYRSLVPLKVDSLLVAGRCLSATHEAAGAVRVMPPCFAMGQATGAAAAIAVQDEVAPRDIDVAKLRQRLSANGAIIDQPV